MPRLELIRTEEFQPYQTELRIGTLEACQKFEAGIRRDNSLKEDKITDIANLNGSGLPKAFQAIYAGLQGIATPPAHKTLAVNSGVEVTREGADGIIPVSIKGKSCGQITNELIHDFEVLEHDIVVSILRKPGFASWIRKHPPSIEELIRLKGERTKRHEHAELKKKEFPS